MTDPILDRKVKEIALQAALELLDQGGLELNIYNLIKNRAEELRRELSQEPVAWMMKNKAFELPPALHWSPQKDWHTTWECIPLYTTPPKREWVGLTNEDKQYLNEVLNLQGRFPIIDAIEAKLKEKNG